MSQTEVPRGRGGEILVQPQLSLVSEWSWRFWMAVLAGWGLSACGEAGGQQSTNTSIALVAEGSSGFGAVFAAGGPAGSAVVWAADPAAGRGRHCQVNLDQAKPVAECEDYCSSDGCPAAVERAAHLLDFDDQERHCFVLGVAASGSVELDCDGDHKLLPLPDSIAPGSETSSWQLAANTGVSPLLAVAAPDVGRAWLYASTRETPVELNIGTEPLPQGFGTDVALLRLGPDRFNSRIIALSAADAGQVWLMRSGFPTVDAPFRVGCLGERPEFGRRLGSGDIDGDGLTDLLVADAEFVTAFSGAALATISTQQSAPGCSLASLPEDAVLASVSCASGGLTSGCEDAGFAASIVVADLDGDADGEIIIGAPGMLVAGKRKGAVLVYDAEGEAPNTLTETLTETALTEDARFGESLGVVQGRNVDAVVVGAPGRGAIFLAPCFSMTRPELRPKICGGS